MVFDLRREVASSLRHGFGLRRASRPRLPAWGDGLVEQPVASLWYPTGWVDVSDDELVFLLPSLAAPAEMAKPQSQARCIDYLRRALCARVYTTAMALFNTSRGAIGEPQQVVDAIAGCGVLKAISPFEAWSEGEAAAHELYHPSCTYAGIGPSGGARGSNAAKWWLFEMSVLACLDDLLGHAIDLWTASETEAKPPVQLGDALTACIHSCFNAAYVYPQFACANELLATGAWLGHLVRGRSALMPDFVASRLAEESKAVPESCESILRFHAEISVGWDRLRTLARRAKARGYAVNVKPRGWVRRSGVSPYIWNEQLHRQISARVNCAPFISR